ALASSGDSCGRLAVSPPLAADSRGLREDCDDRRIRVRGVRARRARDCLWPVVAPSPMTESTLLVSALVRGPAARWRRREVPGLAPTVNRHQWLKADLTEAVK